MSKITEIPIIKQYEEIKKKHPDAVLLFRVGDFYETFGKDALEASKVLGIALIRRMNGKEGTVELAGFPHHALDTYLPKLVRAGKRVAICEQLEDPKLKKGQIESSVKELITPNPLSIPKKLSPDLTSIFSILTVLSEVINKLHTFQQICVKTKELRSLAASIGLSPKKAFEECSIIINRPKSLFD